jgi:hypothetical protein
VSHDFDPAAFIAHYASEYYDPAKAREYYLRTRELKGRDKAQPETKKTKEQRQQEAERERQRSSANQFAQRNIAATERKAMQDAVQANKETVARIRTLITARRQQIIDQVGAYMEALATESEQRREKIAKSREEKLQKIAEDAEIKVASLPEVPKGISRERAAALNAERRRKIAQIRGDAERDRGVVAEAAESELEKLNSDITKKRGAVRNFGRNEQERARKQLQTSLQEAKDNFNRARFLIKAKYNQDRQTEEDAINRSL